MTKNLINRACISINNRCNLNCTYCHFHEPQKIKFMEDTPMNVIRILDNIINYIEKYNVQVFKLGFVGNGEPLLDFDKLKSYVLHIESYLASGKIAAYTITNGTLADKEKLEFLSEHKVNVGFSLDGLPQVHNKFRCNSFDKVMTAVEIYREINNSDPSFNCTVGRDVLERAVETIEFFKGFNSRITFSRMIGNMGITLDEFNEFLDTAKKTLDVRTGGFNCTMYGGKCAAGINNYFFANNRIYICGNCVDFESEFTADTPLDEIDFKIINFDRNKCFREVKEYEICSLRITVCR